MKYKYIITIFLFMSAAAGCTIEFDPGNDNNQKMLVVEGMITNQNRINRIRLSQSTQTGMPVIPEAVTGAIVTITDENGINTTLTESHDGIYSTDSTEFIGRVGGSYSLNIKIGNVSYGTDFIEMKPVPPINSLYYEKVVITASKDTNYIEEGCKIYVDTYDPSGECLYYRWDYFETWEYHIPFNVTNRICYVTELSDEILIKNTSPYSQARISEYPILFISNKSDRLNETYSILVNQYSITGSEYSFWERIRNISQNVGNLYDIIPMAIPGNIRCNSDPGEQVLGYFSVSAVSQKRLFIHDKFYGLPYLYFYCATDTLSGNLPETGLNTEFWVLEDNGNEIPPFWVISTLKECADCSARGTSVRPSYWIDY